ncbi:RNA polymerase sigma factor [Cesiribacter sp. SM1]|uniref:RNA polymerase sigma factor n=1 Tax=Cesiribacter sp. SM1 TaxID=2861196 RepID=UPI001CD52918|nr:sigma-70 family RNA polymerase sigma factor [Cesiribacter sp. SM1]
MSEKELIERCIARERQYQEVLYRKYADKMYNVCLTYTKDEDEAADVLQEGFIKVFANLNNYTFGGSFEGWIRKIMVNTALVQYQKKRKETENLSVYKTYIEPAVETILETIHADAVIELVNNLPEKAGLVLKLYAIEGYDHQEIADLMGISVGTSKSQLNRARFLLKEAMLQVSLEEKKRLA